MQKNNKNSRSKLSSPDSGRERGVALVAVMLTLLLITAIAAGIIILANTETNTSSNFKDEQRAFFSAKAGIEEARDRLRKNNTYTITRPTGLPGSSSSSILYITNPNAGDTVQPWCGSGSGSCANVYADDELCQETLSGSVGCSLDTNTNKSYPSGSYYTTVSADSTFAPTSGSKLDWKWVRVTLKQDNSFGARYYVNGNTASSAQVYWNGTGECTTGVTPCTLPVYVLTALAKTPSGSRRMVQMEAAEDQLNFTAPAALTLDGTNDQFSGGTANGWAVTGTDTSVPSCGTGTGTAVPAVGVSDGTPATTTTTGHGSKSTTTTTPATGDIANVINGYGTGSGIPSKNTSSYTGLSSAPDVENVSSTYTSDLLDSATDLQKLVSTLKNDITQPVVAAGTSVSGGGNLFNSSPGSPQIVYANGDLTLSGSSTGYGILVVTGTLTMKGTVTWNGIILVVGTGNLQTDGTNQYNGAVVVAKTTGGSIGTPTFAVNGGGNAGVNYSSACVAQATTLTTFHSVSFRELMN